MALLLLLTYCLESFFHNRSHCTQFGLQLSDVLQLCVLDAQLLNAVYFHSTVIRMYVCTGSSCKMCALPSLPFPAPEPSRAHVKVGVPQFQPQDCSSVYVIGSGSFGVVTRCLYNAEFRVVKKLNDGMESDNNINSLYNKEVTLLDKVKNHPHIASIIAYCPSERSIMMEYVFFDLSCLGWHTLTPAYSLNELLLKLAQGDYSMCAHLPQAVAKDVASGLQHLHSRNIVHRDLKSANVLVSNAHYAHLEQADVQKWWAARPVLCKLTDFGEARSVAVKTRLHLTATVNQNLLRGSPVYQAPEVYVGNQMRVEISDYKRMDIWSMAMIIYDALNPGMYPFKVEFANTPIGHDLQAFLTQQHTGQILPTFCDTYRTLLDGVWAPLKAVFDICAVHDPSRRPTANDICHMLVVKHVAIHDLHTSQATLVRLVTRKNKVKVNVDTSNACTFLALLVSNAVVSHLQDGTQLTAQDIARLARLAIDNFPTSVNELRDRRKMYDISSAYDILLAAQAIVKLEFNFAITSQAETDRMTALDDLRYTLAGLISGDKRFVAVYVIPPLTVMICSPASGKLCIADTHPVSRKCGGNSKHGVVVESLHKESAIIAVSDWLFARMCTDTVLTHELAVVSTVSVHMMPVPDSASCCYDSPQQLCDATAAPTLTTEPDAGTFSQPHMRAPIPSTSQQRTHYVSNEALSSSECVWRQIGNFMDGYGSNSRWPHTAVTPAADTHVQCTGQPLLLQYGHGEAHQFRTGNEPTKSNVARVNSDRARLWPASDTQQNSGHAGVADTGTPANDDCALSSGCQATHSRMEAQGHVQCARRTCDSSTVTDGTVCRQATTSGSTTVEYYHRERPVPERSSPSTKPWDLLANNNDLPTTEDDVELDSDDCAESYESVEGGNEEEADDSGTDEEADEGSTEESKRRVPDRSRRGTAIFTRLETWAGCQEQEVHSLPHDVDGLKRYMIKCRYPEMMKLTRDCHRWKRWSTTSRKDFNGVRRFARCSGCLRCPSKECPILKTHKAANKWQFRRNNGQPLCFSCGSVAERLPCPAVKIWEYDWTRKAAVVYHYETHTCVPKPIKPKREDVIDIISKYPGCSATEILHHEMKQRLRQETVTDSDFQTIYDALGNMQNTRNVQQAVRDEQSTCGSDFDAVVALKQKLSDVDKYLIYQINGKGMNDTPAYVFKASRSMAQLACEMDRNKDGCLNTEYAFFDAKHDHCRGYKSVTLWTYHPSMRRLVRLAIMEAETENTECLTLFWQILNRMLCDYSGIQDYRFNPKGFMCDEHHANFTSIETVFGRDAAARVKTCEFHFKQSVHRRTRRLPENIREEFDTLALKWLQAPTSSDCESAGSVMTAFCNDHSNLLPWWNWWWARRTHVCRAYKASDTPASNLAEVGHSQMTAWGKPNASLLDAAEDDVVQALRQTADLAAFEQGQPTGGKGRSVPQTLARKHRRELQRADAIGRRLTTEMESQEQEVYVPKSGIHRPPRQPRSRNSLDLSQKQALRHANQQVRRSAIALRSANSRRRNVRLQSLSNVVRVGVPSAVKQPATAVNRDDDDTTFNVVECSPSVTVCYGCKLKFRAMHRTKPKNLILRVLCHRHYTTADGARVRAPNRAAAYLHLKISCMRLYNPAATKDDIFLDEDVRHSLSEEQLSWLEECGVFVESDDIDD